MKAVKQVSGHFTELKYFLERYWSRISRLRVQSKTSKQLARAYILLLSIIHVFIGYFRSLSNIHPLVSEWEEKTMFSILFQQCTLIKILWADYDTSGISTLKAQPECEISCNSSETSFFSH